MKSGAGEVDILNSVDCIEFRNVNFAFGGAKAKKNSAFSLRNISFKINKGEKVTVVGKIGSGKTSLLNLLSLIYTPDAGEILINGRQLSDFDPVLYRSRLGYIVQEPVVFSETVTQNIRSEMLQRSATFRSLVQEEGGAEQAYSAELV